MSNGLMSIGLRRIRDLPDRPKPVRRTRASSFTYEKSSPDRLSVPHITSLDKGTMRRVNHAKLTVAIGFQ